VGKVREERKGRGAAISGLCFENGEGGDQKKKGKRVTETSRKEKEINSMGKGKKKEGKKKALVAWGVYDLDSKVRTV